MKKVLICILLCGLIGTNLISCEFIDGFKEGLHKSSTNNSKNNTINTQSSSQDKISTSTNNSEKQLKDVDGKFEISVPKSWSNIKKV